MTTDTFFGIFVHWALWFKTTFYRCTSDAQSNGIYITSYFTPSSNKVTNKIIEKTYKKVSNRLLLIDVTKSTCNILPSIGRILKIQLFFWEKRFFLYISWVVCWYLHCCLFPMRDYYLLLASSVELDWDDMALDSISTMYVQYGDHKQNWYVADKLLGGLTLGHRTGLALRRCCTLEG